MNNTSLRIAGTFISVGRFPTPDGGTRSKICLLAKLSRFQPAQLIFADASPVEQEIQKLGISNREKVQVLLNRDGGNRVEQIISLKPHSTQLVSSH